MIVMRTSYCMVIFSTLIAGLGFAGAEASALQKGDLNAPEAAPLILVQDLGWYCGPKWGGIGRRCLRSYRDSSPGVRSYGYSSPRVRSYRYTSPRARSR